MPGFVKTPKDEARWTKAKNVASKSKSKSEKEFTDQDWGLVNHVYQNMSKFDVVKSILEKAKDRLNDEDSEPDAAEEWLKQHGSNVEDDERSDDAVDVDAGDQGSTDAQKSGKDTQKKVKDLDPERLKALKDLSHHWLSHADQMKKQSADARSNPHLFAEGHRQAAHNAAHSNFDEAHRNFVSSPGYQALSPVKKMRAEAQFKKEFQENNPDYHKNSVNAVAQAHGMHEKASALHGKEMNARKAHILSGGQSAGETMSASEAAQHVGAGKNDEGEYSTATVKDPAASFASQYGQHLASESKPVVEESDEYESLDNPNKKIIKHPALDDPKNKKLIEDFFKEYHPYISKAAFKARAKAVANGMPEDKIDVSGLHEAGMHGLMQAVRDYSPEVGSSFKNHAKAKMGGLMQSHLSSQDYVPRDLRSKMKAKEKGILNTPIEQPTTKDTVEAVSTAKPKIAVHDVVSSSGHPDAENIADRLKRTNTQRSVIRRPKGE